MQMNNGIDEGVRARIGVVVPSVNTVVEPWFGRVAPAGVTVHTARMMLAPRLSPESVIEMDRTEGMLAIRQISSCRPASIAYCCTASSVVQGQLYDEHLRHEIENESGARATTATHAILSALNLFGASRVCIVSPYNDEVDAMEHRFFERAGLRILGSANLGIDDTFALASPDAPTLIELARRGWAPEADVLVMTCLNTRSHFVIDAIEKEIHKPVVTSTTATLWHALRLAGIADPIHGYGRLLATP
jgi:maleate isomerase